jgi:hypothetical protein
MGISFTDVSEENRASLKELVWSFARPHVFVGTATSSAASASKSLGSVPEISNPKRALQAMTEFFQTRTPMTREDFLQLLQGSEA